MGWWRQMFRSKPSEEYASPQDIMLNATLGDLRRVALELQETNRAFAERVEKLKETPRANPSRRSRTT